MKLQPDRLIEFPDQAALLHGIARLMVETLAAQAAPMVNLTGGGTAALLYALLADEYRDKIDWPALTLTWGDERFVPPGDPDHNATAAWNALLEQVPVTPSRVHVIPTEQPIETCVHAYEALLGGLTRPGLPLFDLTLLSLGEDGHIASLLPGQPALDEQYDWVAAVPHGRPEQRITLTYPCLQKSERLILIASGKAKSAVLRDLLAGAEQYPASKLIVNGELLLVADRAALQG